MMKFAIKCMPICSFYFFLLGLFLFHLNTAQARAIPELQARVNDYAGILLPSTIAQVENSLKFIEQEESTQIVVLTITSLEDEPLEDFSIRVADSWKIGQKNLDNGAILLISKEDRKIRIEVGYGLEGTLTDFTSGRIIRNIILPQFKKGRFDQGVIDGVSAMTAAVKGEFNAKEMQSETKKSEDHVGFLTMVIFVLVLLGNLLRKKKWFAAIVGGIVTPALGILFLGFSWYLTLLLIPLGMVGGLFAASLKGSSSKRRRGRRYRGSSGTSFGNNGGLSGGFSGGGGGGFGGGGASGGW